MRAPKAVVGLGASAGGLTSLRELLAHTPPDTGLAFVVVMHLSPDRESHLAELLQARSELPVLQVTEAVALEANHVYVVPPNRNVDTSGTELRLSPLEGTRRDRAPIDRFFRTLAAAHQRRAVAVVLSGTGSDGSVGLCYVKEAGGLTIAQNPEEAEYSGMPESALATHRVDLTLPVAEIPREIVRCLAVPHPDVAVRSEDDVAGAETETDADSADRRVLRAILELLFDRTGHDFSLYKPSMLLRRLSRRGHIGGISTLADYLVVLRSNEGELAHLHHDLLITVSSFFRDRELFEFVEHNVIPSLFEGKKARDELRAWSVGCATGEEPYSLAMLLLERATQQTSAPTVQIFATDVSENALAHAREGVYAEVIEGDVSAERLRRFFVAEGGSSNRVNPKLRASVVFAKHNVLADPPFAKIDLIVCRNLLIYLKREVKDRLLELFHYALRPGGYLFLGSSETAGECALFRPARKEGHVYRRLDVQSENRGIPKFPVQASHHHLSARPSESQRATELSFGALHAQLAEAHAPPSVLVTGGGKVVHRSETAGRYLRLGGGEPNDDLQRQILPALGFELRKALEAVGETERSVTSTAISIQLDGETRQVALHVRPASASEGEGFVVVSFWEIPGAGPNLVDPRHGIVDEGGGEAEMLRERLRAVVREHEMRDEKMAASNEELQSINEELRSTTEELETSKEELQSMNEELVTVNQENKDKVTELTTLSADLQNLLGATDIATLFLDRELRIRRFTPRVSDLFSILLADQGRRLSDLTHRLGYDIIFDVTGVLTTLSPLVRELRTDDGKWFLIRAVPYRTVEDEVDGVVVTFVDVTELKDAQEMLRKLAADLTLAEQRERERIAQVLHDNIQQLLFSVQYKLQSMRTDAAIEAGSAIAEELAEADALIQSTIQAARTLVVEMSPPVLKDEGLRTMLEWLKSHMKELHELEVELDLDLDDDTALTRDQRVLLFQSARELLFNVVKHAEVKSARVEAYRDKRDFFITVRDGGKGFEKKKDAPDKRGLTFGISTLRERLALMDGGLEVLSSPGRGTRATIRMSIGREA